MAVWTDFFCGEAIGLEFDDNGSVQQKQFISADHFGIRVALLIKRFQAALVAAMREPFIGPRFAPVALEAVPLPIRPFFEKRLFGWDPESPNGDRGSTVLFLALVVG